MVIQPVHYETLKESIVKDCTISFLRGSGPGGQNRNKVETGVRLHHGPSGLIVTATDGRSQEENRKHALDRLQSRLYRLNRKQIPRIPTKVPRSQKRQRLSDKRVQSTKKNQRKQPLVDIE